MVDERRESQAMIRIEDEIIPAIADKADSGLIGEPDGIASLDGFGKLPVSQLPVSVMEYKGAWNASTNSPVLIDGAGDAGDIYQVVADGTQNLGSGSITFKSGVQAIMLYGNDGKQKAKISTNLGHGTGTDGQTEVDFVLYNPDNLATSAYETVSDDGEGTVQQHVVVAPDVFSTGTIEYKIAGSFLNADLGVNPLCNSTGFYSGSGNYSVLVPFRVVSV